MSEKYHKKLHISSFIWKTIFFKIVFSFCILKTWGNTCKAHGYNILMSMFYVLGKFFIFN